MGYPTTIEQAILRLSDLLGRKDHAIFVAENQSGEAIGWIHVFEVCLLESPAMAEIGGLVVDQAARGQGVGKALVCAARQWAVVRGYPTLWVRSNIIRERAHHFYDELGFRRLKTQVVFTQDLDARQE